MFSHTLSLVKRKLCRVVHQGSMRVIVRFYTVFALRMFEFYTGHNHNIVIFRTNHRYIRALQVNYSENSPSWGYVTIMPHTVFAFRVFELVAAIQTCIQNWKTFPMIFTRLRNKI